MAEGVHLVDGRLRKRRMSMRIRRFMAELATFFFVAMMAASPVLAKEMPVPEKPSLYVKDDAGVLNVEQKDDLDEMLKKYDKETGNQIAVLLIRTTGDESIEKYSYRVATAWGVGQKGKDNGILVTIATEDRKDRIEVGKGLESEVTDSRAGRILRTREVTRSFRRKRWNDGIRSIISQLQECIRTKGASVDRRSRLDAILVKSVSLLVLGGVWISVISRMEAIGKKIRKKEKKKKNSQVIKGLTRMIPLTGAAVGIRVMWGTLIGPEDMLVPMFLLTFFTVIVVRTIAYVLGVKDSGWMYTGGGSSHGGTGGGSSHGGSSFGGGSFGGGGASGGW